MAKKKKKLVSGYFDANTGTRITDSHIEENDSGWRIVKNEPTPKQNSNSVSKITNSHLQRYNLDGTPKIPIADSITNRNIINLGVKNKLTDSLQNSISQKTGNINQQSTSKIDLSGKSYLQDTGKTYGDYYYDNYSQNKDKKIYINTKDGSYFLNNNGKYEKLGTGITSNINTMTTKSAEDKKIKEAKQQGYKGSQSSQKLEKYLKEVSKKTGFTNEELYTIASDYENGKWKPASSKYAEISSRLNKAGYQGYEVANKINKLKKESTQDINTTITNEVFPQKQIPWYKKILKGSEAFDDGYDVGDITKTVVATAQDIGANVGEGFLGTLEGISDTLQYGTADLMDLFKKKSAAKAIRNNAKFNSTAAIFGKNEKEEDNFVKGWTEKVDRNSVSGQGLDSISQGVGNIGAFVGASYLTGGSSASSFLTTFSSAYGNAKSNAYQNGATDKTATETAIVSGLSEAISEQFFNKIPGMKTQGWGEKLVGKVGSKTEKYFGTKTGKVVMNILDNSGEGFEEIISDILNTTGNNIVHTVDKDYNGNLSLQTDTWLESFVYASITSALVNGGNTVLSNTQKNQILKAYAEENNMTLNQAKSVLNQEIQLRADNIETNDLRERTNTEKETQKQVLNEMKQNTYTADERISIPQEVEQEVKQEVQEELQEEPSKQPTIPVEKMNEILNDVVKKSDVEFTQEEISELRESMYKQVEKLGAKVEENINFVKSAEQHNFNSNSEEIKSVGRIMEARDIKSSFDSTPFVNNSEAALWSIDNNGKRSVIFNPNADEKTIFQNVAVHELTHDLLSSENSAEKLDKQDLLTYISKIEDYEEARKDLEDAYARVYDRDSSEFKNLVDEEAIASVLGSKLGNQEFINRLNGQKPNLARRIYNWVVDKIDNIGKSAEYKAEKKYWKEVADRFEKAFNMEYNRSTNEADTRFATLKNNPYGHVKDFVKLSNKIQSDAHRVIEHEANLMLKDGLKFGSAKDINGNIYYFEIFNDGNYRVTKVDKYNNTVEEVLDEKYFKTDSRYSIRDTKNESTKNARNNESIENRKTSSRDAKLLKTESKQQRKNENRQTNDEIITNSRELDNSSFSYRGSHQIENAKSITDIDLEEVKNKIIDIDGYLTNQASSDFNKLKKIVTNPNETVKIYRAAPVNELNNGDWVTTDKSYAKNVADNNGGKVYTYEVRADQLYYPDNIKELPSLHRLSSFQYIENSNTQTTSKDSQGRTLSKEQQEYFKDSKVRDENGQLITVYHGTTEEINIFDKNRLGKNTGAASAGEGFFFTDNKKIAEDYSKYARPQYIKDLENEYKRLEKIAQKTGNWDDYYRAYEKYEDAELTYAYNEDNQRTNAENQKEVYLNLTNPLIHDFKGMEYRDESYYDLLKQAKESGNDGAIFKNTYDGYGEKGSWDNPMTNIYVAFESNQIKNVDNTNPTTNDDIRYSQDTGKWDAFVNKNFSSKGKKTTFGELKNKNNNIPISKTFEKEESNKKIETKENNIKQEKNTPKEKNTIEERIPDVIEVRQSPMDKTSLNKLSKNMAKELYLNNSQTTDLKDVIQDFYRRDFNEYSKKDLFNSIKDKFSEHNEKIIADDSLNDIQQQIKNTKIKVPEQIKEGIGDYNNLRQSNFGKTKLGNTGIELDSFYDELASDYPAYFDSELTGEDQLLRIIDVANMDNSYTETYKLDDNYIQDITDYIDESIKDYKNQELRNLAEKEIKAKYKEDKKTYALPNQRQAKTKQYREQAKKYAEETIDWKDKGLANQKLNTMKRNLRDIAGVKTGNEIYNEYFEPILKHNAEIEKQITKYNEKIKNLKLSNKESTAVQMLGELKHNPQTTIRAKQVNDFIQKNKLDRGKIEKAVEVFRNTYDELFTRVNDVLKEQGYKEIDYRKGYFPHFNEEHGKTILGKFAEKLGWTFKSGSLPTNIAGITDEFKPGKKWTSFSQRRTGDITEYNALKGFDNYVRGAMQVIYHTEDIQKLRALEAEIRYQHSDKGLQEKLDKIFEDDSLFEDEREDRIEYALKDYNNNLGNFVTNLRDYTNNLAGKKSALDRSTEQFAGRKIYNTMDNITRRVSGNMVGGNIASAFTNFIPITQAWSQISTKNMIKSMSNTITNSITKTDNLQDRSNYLTTRTKQADRLFKTGLDKATDKAGIIFEAIDHFTSETIVRGKYYENLEKGMSETEALRNADEFAKDVMAGRSQGDMPTIFNSKNPFVKLFSAFQLEVNNQYGYMFKDLPIAMRNEGMGKLIFAFLKMFLGAWLYNEAAEKLTGRKSAFSPIDIVGEAVDITTNDNLDAFTKGTKITKNISQEIPFVGSLLGGGRIPISSALPDTETTFRSTTNLFKENKREKAIKDLTKELSKPLLYIALPFGGGQAKKTYEGLSMFSDNKEIKGNYTPTGKLRFPIKDTVPKRIQAALFGQYASEEAREYFDQNRSALTENQQKELKVLDIPISDYWEIKSGLSDISNKLKGSKKTTEERKEIYYKYIDSLKIGKDKKKLLKKLQYKSYTESDEDIKDYISSIKTKKTTKKDLLKKMGLDD